MSSKFWFAYSCFFAFIFPLFFSFSGSYTWSPLWSTVSLLIGVVAWILFILWTYKKAVVQPRELQRSIHEVVEHGHLAQGRILKRTLLKIHEDKREDLEINVEFKNFSGTLVQHNFEFTDSQPYSRRYEEGSSINLRLNKAGTAPAVLLADTKTQLSAGPGTLAVSFVILYAVATFIGHYMIFSEGNGWRFITLWHPWVFTPFTAYFIFNIGGLFGKMFGGTSASDKLLLYGKRVTAKVQRAEQTGTYINEQPQIKYILYYQDDKGSEHVVEMKRIVSLTQMHTLQQETQDILYLPDQPEEIIFVD